MEERERAQFEYGEYVKREKRLETVIIKTKQKVKSMKTPKRMGNSEARLHKMVAKRQRLPWKEQLRMLKRELNI